MNFLIAVCISVLLTAATVDKTKHESVKLAYSNKSINEKIYKVGTLFRRAKYREAKSLIRSIHRNAESVSDVQKAKLYLLESQILSNAECNYTRSLHLANAALDLARQSRKKSLELRTLRVLADFSRDQGRRLLAVQYFQKAMSLLDEECSVHERNLTTLGLADAYIAAGRFPEAHDLLNNMREIERTSIRIRRLVSFAEIDYQNKRFDAASRRIASAEALRKRQKTKGGYDLLLSKGKILMAIGQVSEARICYERLATEIGIMTRTVVSKAQLGLAQVEFAEGSLDQCQIRLNTLFQTEKTPELRKQIITAQIRCAAELGDTDAIAALFDRRAQYEERLEHERMAGEIAFLQQEFDHQQKLQQEEIQRRELLLLQSQLSHSQTLQLILLSFSCLLVVTIVLSANFLLKKRIADKDLENKRKLLEQKTKLNRILRQKIDERVAELEKKQAEQLQLQQQLSIKRRDEALGKLTGGVAHDFNNLIQVIRNVNELISEQMAEYLTPSVQHLLLCSEQATESAAEITSRLLMFAKKRELQPSTIELQQFFENYMPLLQQSVGARNRLSLVFQEHASVFLDETQFLSTIINLCSNSRDALLERETNPEVKIIVRNLDRKSWLEENCDSFVSYSQPDPDAEQLVIISLHDNGCGMSEEQLHKACVPFYSSKSSQDTLSVGGTGLGLSATQGFLEKSGAGFQINSRPGSGTTVRMIIRQQLLPGDDTKLKPNHDQLSLNGKRILLVEDNEMLLHTIQMSLELAGCVVTGFASGTQAKIHLKSTSERFDVVLTDIRMPDSIDGISLAKWVTRHTKNLPVVLMTGFSDKEVSSTFPVIRKPFVQQTLIAAIQEVLAKEHTCHAKH